MAAMVGELAVEFSLPDTDAQLRWMNEFHRLGPLVLVFVPSVQGWRPQWQFWSLMRHYDAFVELATEIVIVSGDPLPELRIFQIRRGLPFVFLSDREGGVARSYRLADGHAASVVIAVSGVIRYHRVSAPGKRSSGRELLRAVRGLDQEDLTPRVA